MSSPIRTPTTRSSRAKKPSLKALESLYTAKLKNSGFVIDISSDDEQLFSDTDEEIAEIEKPKLLHQNEHVGGDEIFKFQTRKQRVSLAQKVAEACAFKTPHKVRDKIRKEIAAKMVEDDSGSEYNCSSSSEETSETSEEQSESESEEEVEKIQTRKGRGKIESDSEQEVEKIPPRRTRRKLLISDEESESESELKKPVKPKPVQEIQPKKGRGRPQKNYTIKTDEYFACSTGKNKTSNNTLDKLETPRLPQHQLQKLLEKVKLSDDHETAVNNLKKMNHSHFTKWLYLLNEGFNILLYGLGSKRNILETFHTEFIKDQPVIVVNGFFPTLSIKNVLDGIIVELLELEENPANVFEACDLIEKEFSYDPDTHLYLIVHNIEGEMLRNGKTQSVFARLATIRNIHLVASIDHINAPLIWDHNKLSKFNYIWFDVTSYLPYTEETSYEKSMMVQKSGTLALSSLRNVFLSLTTNSKSIYLMIVKYQLENGKNHYYQGIAFKDLYMSCREAFIVSSDLALRAQLTEFVDHKMVKIKRSMDGTEYLIIPLANGLLQKFLEEHNT